MTISACNEEINAASCTASTEFDNNYRCGNTIDGKPDTNWATQGQGVGSWIKLDFEKIHWVEKLKIKHRSDSTGTNEMFKEIELEFSSGVIIGSTLHMVSGNWSQIDLDDPLNTDFVKITAISVYGTANNGFSEIQIFGCPIGITHNQVFLNTKPNQCLFRSELVLG